MLLLFPHWARLGLFPGNSAPAGEAQEASVYGEFCVKESALEIWTPCIELGTVWQLVLPRWPSDLGELLLLSGSPLHLMMVTFGIL